MFWSIIKAVGSLPAIFDFVTKLYTMFVDACQADYLAAKSKELEAAVKKAKETKGDTSDIDKFYRGG